MTRAEAEAKLESINPEALFADGFDEAILGVGQQFNKHFVVYDRAKCIKILMDRDGMDREGAEEYFEFNTVGSWVGEYTPIFVELE